MRLAVYAPPPDFQDLRFGYFSVTAALSFGSSAMGFGVMIVFLIGSPAKITLVVVSRVAIIMGG